MENAFYGRDILLAYYNKWFIDTGYRQCMDFGKNNKKEAVVF